MDFSGVDTLSSSTSLFIAANELPTLFTILTKSAPEMPWPRLRVVRIGRDDFTRNLAGLPSLRAAGLDCSKVISGLKPDQSARSANLGYIGATAAALSTASQQNGVGIRGLYFPLGLVESAFQAVIGKALACHSAPAHLTTGTGHLTPDHCA